MSTSLPTILCTLPGKFTANTYAGQMGSPAGKLTAKVVNLENHFVWIALYQDDTEVWRCNPQFFSANFYRSSTTSEEHQEITELEALRKRHDILSQGYRNLTASLEAVRKERDELKRAIIANTTLLANLGGDHWPRVSKNSFGQYQLVGCKCGFDTTSEDELVKHMATPKLVENIERARELMNTPIPGWNTKDHDDLTSVDHADALERIHCPKAGEILHSGCGWCKEHNRPAFECQCNGPRVTARTPSGALMAPLCENCSVHPAVHGEHWYDKKRWWCHLHVPMSGHYEHCPESCRGIVKQVTPPNVFADLAKRHEHLRKP